MSDHDLSRPGPEPFAPERPHISVALIMSGTFGQFADPLDWIAERFGLDVKVDRSELSESLGYRKIGQTQPIAQARGMDGKTWFKLEFMGRFEGRVIAQARVSFQPHQISPEMLEERAIEAAVLNPMFVLGIQYTRGAVVQPLAGQALEKAETYIRLLPQNVFSKTFFASQIAALTKNKKVALSDLGDVVFVQLAKPWLFYDVPIPKRRGAATVKMLPLWRGAAETTLP